MTLVEKYNQFLAYKGIDYKQHQYDGLEWCASRETGKAPLHDVRGGFIADEMGLGKTIMTIGLIAVNFLEYRRTLVVLPSILVEQWAQEDLPHHRSRGNDLPRVVQAKDDQGTHGTRAYCSYYLRNTRGVRSAVKP
jgi:hypothetical protein